MVMESWAGKTPDQIAAELHCHPQTIRIHVARFNQQGIDGLGVQPGSGRKLRLTEAERSVIVALPSQPPSGRLVTGRWWRAMKVGRLSGAWMRWRRRPKRRASESNAARSAVSC
jgi:transposase